MDRLFLHVCVVENSAEPIVFLSALTINQLRAGELDPLQDYDPLDIESYVGEPTCITSHQLLPGRYSESPNMLSLLVELIQNDINNKVESEKSVTTLLDILAETIYAAAHKAN